MGQLETVKLLGRTGSRISSHPVWEDFHMSSRTLTRCVRVAVMPFVVVSVLCSMGIMATAQDQPAPKWEIFGGYSFFDPGTNVHGLLPGGVLV